MRTKLRGFSVVELIVAVSFITIVMGSVAYFSIESARGSLQQERQFTGTLKMQRDLNAILLNKQDLWFSMVENTNDGAKHISPSGDTYVIDDGVLVEDGVTTSFTIGTVPRNEDGDIDYTVEDYIHPSTRVIEYTASWTDASGTDQEISNVLYVTNWNNDKWLEDVQVDFQDGTFTGTIDNTRDDGNVELDLEDIVKGDWCLPDLTRSEYNLSGLSWATAIWSDPNDIYLGTGYGYSGETFRHILVDNEVPTPGIIEEGSWDDEDRRANDIVGVGDYAYIATNDNSQEVVILDISSPPYSVVGWVDLPTSLDARALYIDDENDIGYVIQLDTLYAFDLSSKTGSRPTLGSMELVKNGEAIIVQDGYAYIAISGSSYEMQIVDVTPANNMQSRSVHSVNGANGSDIALSPDGNLLYLGTGLQFFSRELFIVNVSNKSNPNTIDSADLGLTSVTGLTVIDEVLVVVGWFSTEYRVYSLLTPTELNYCGGLNWNWGINDVSSAIDPEENAWSYILTNDIYGELHIILGGDQPGGGGGGGGGNGEGDEYLPEGWYESSVFDTGSSSTYYYSIEWDEEQFENTDLQLQVRSGPSSDLSARPWYGPDATDTTWFTIPYGEELPVELNNNRYVQYRAYFTSDKVNTAYLELVRINYETQ